MVSLKPGRFASVVWTLLIVYGVIKWLIPAVSRQITGLPFPLTVPGTLVFIYMLLTVVALFMFVTFSDQNLEEFLDPVKRLLRGEYGKFQRNIVLVIVPLIFGWQVYGMNATTSELPASLRIQHPASNFPKDFEELENPLANPTDAEVSAFVEQAQSDQPALIPQLLADMDAWQAENPDRPWLAAIATAPVRKFLEETESGKVSADTARAALLEKTLFEGRALYAMNCRPCHGDSANGDGPLADGLKLRPINFTDNGTIETIVEGYTFWRVSTGGQALPVEATPWDSGMPQWQLNLTEEERWKIILAEYDLAEKTPRMPESH